MATKRVTHTFRKGDILEVKEYHDGRYGARGLPREKKRKPTPEQMAVVNAMNKAETARHRLLEYFGKSKAAHQKERRHTPTGSHADGEAPGTELDG